MKYRNFGESAGKGIEEVDMFHIVCRWLLTMMGQEKDM
jgi:hypothetical protein